MSSMKCSAKTAEVYAFYLKGHNISETAMYYGMRRQDVSLYIKLEKAADRAAAAEGRVRSHELPEVSTQSKERWMSDGDMRLEYNLAADKLKQIAILAQLNGLNPRAVEKIVRGSSS